MKCLFFILFKVRDILLGELHFTGALTELNMSPKATPPSSLSPKHPQERLLFGDDQILNCVEQLSPSTSRPIPVKTETLNAEATDFLPGNLLCIISITYMPPL